jgi:hypothetical protein
MSAPEHKTSCYFALPRLIYKLVGGVSERSENNSVEAYLGGIAIFAITYALLVDLLLRQLTGWQALLGCIALAIGVWIFWVIVLYLNSLAIQALRACGLFRKTANRHAQNILVGIVVTLFAGELSRHDSSIRWIGIVWLAFLIMNLAAASLLALISPESKEP